MMDSVSSQSQQLEPGGATAFAAGFENVCIVVIAQFT